MRFGLYFRSIMALIVILGISPRVVQAAATDQLIPSALVLALKDSHFEEPLVATAGTSEQENTALLSAIDKFSKRTKEDDFSDLQAFLGEYPRSGWSVAIHTNLGLLEYHYGYFSRALVDFSEAWTKGRSATDPGSKALVDRAVGELARMHAKLGHADELAALLADIGDRPISGPATESITGAREGLVVMRTNPGIAYLCGPMALKNLMISQHATYKDVEFLDAVRSGPHGVTLRQVSELATKAKLHHTVIFRDPSQPVPVPSIIHWRVSHFAAITGERDGRFHIIDPTFGTDLWITKSAIDAESDGYFLVPVDNKTLAWREASASETEKVRGMGFPGTSEPGDTCSCSVPAQPSSSSSSSNPPLAEYSFKEMLVNLHISDTPVGYDPPIGPSAKVQLNYNQREAGQPSSFSYFNVSQKWTINWLAYIQDDPNYPGSTVSRYVAGGGYIDYTQQCDYVKGVCYYYDPTTGVFPAETRDASVLSRTTAGSIIYTRKLADGSVETYGASNGATTYPRLVFLTKITDPAGNSVSLTYDNQQRLTSIKDATGRSTTLSYGVSTSPLLITKITDPFGRSAKFKYDSTGRLIQITDILGLTSTFTYDASSLISAMTTPYGKTTFTYGQNGTYRYLTATDPLGNTERLEWNQPAPSSSGLLFNETQVPAGIINPFNEYITGRDTFYWDKHAYAVAAGDYSKSRIRHWMHNSNDTNEMYHSLESIKYPFENRIWMNYPGQPNTGFSGTLDLPSRIGRILDDGTTQLSQIAYNSLGQVTDTIDPVGRETQTTYAANGIDPVLIQQRTSPTGFSTTAKFTYNDQHLPLTSTDAAGQTTSYEYNTAGQLAQIKDALGETTKFNYNALGYLTSVINANGHTQSSYTYDTFGRVATTTDSEGYAVEYSYDAANRVTKQTFPDATSRDYAYTNLDLTSVTDRQGKTTKYSYDGIRNLVETEDPLQHVTKYGYFENQTLKSLTDPNGNTTSWNIDVENRVTGKQYADGSQVTNIYETTTSRLHSVTDALKQVKTSSYAPDNMLTGIAYTHSVNPTPNVTFTYDAHFPRVASMTDGTGSTTYAYRPVGSIGALQLASETGPFKNATIAYTYDDLSRMATRTIDTSAESFSYDKLSRLVGDKNDLGDFALTYLGQTGQLTSQSSNPNVGTQLTYEPNVNDRRLKAIINSGAARSYAFKTTPENLIPTIEELPASNKTGVLDGKPAWQYIYDDSYRLTGATSPTGSAFNFGYDAADNITSGMGLSKSATASYNDLNQVTDVREAEFNDAGFLYDADGNLLDDGSTKTFHWDAENRLIRVNHKSNSAIYTTFKYDGLGRRVSMATTNASGTQTSHYMWCGERLCQSRNSTDAVARRYYSEGEYSVITASGIYYGQDQLGSVRDALSSKDGSLLATNDYIPFGYQQSPPNSTKTDFGYAGMFTDTNDGLYLSVFRVYDPEIARWLSRDPIRELGGLNIYAYAADAPNLWTDIEGLDCCTSVNLTSDEIMAVQTVLGENSWYLLGYKAYQHGDKLGHPSGAIITSTTIYAEDLAMFSIFVNRTKADDFPDTIGKVATQQGQFIGYNSGPTGGITKYTKALTSAPGSSMCQDLLEAISSLGYVQANGSLLAPSYLYWKAINQGDTLHRYREGDIYVGNTAFGTSN